LSTTSHAQDPARPTLVTGGAGFVGTTLVSQLLAAGRRVVVYDNLFAGARPVAAPGLTLVEGDVRDAALLSSVLREHQPSSVVHLAALHYIPYCDAHPVDTIEVNVVGTQTIIEACREHPVDRMVFASSAAVYGVSAEPHGEDSAIFPQDVYGLSKRFGEEQLAAFHRLTGTPSVAARLFNVFGRGETNPHVIPEMLRQVREHPDVLNLGNLDARRDYVHVTDVAGAIRLFLDSNATGWRTYNVGTGVSSSVADIVSALEAVLGHSIRIEQSPGRIRKVDRPNLQANNARIRAELGWAPRVTLADGLRDLLDETPRGTSANLIA
jgi:UDP-glucose 4-epimerase